MVYLPFIDFVSSPLLGSRMLRSWASGQVISATTLSIYFDGEICYYQHDENENSQSTPKNIITSQISASHSPSKSLQQKPQSAFFNTKSEKKIIYN